MIVSYRWLLTPLPPGEKMNAQEFLASRGRSVPTHPVKIMLTDSTTGNVAEADAILRFVTDGQRLAAGDRAAESLAKLNIKPTDDRRAAEEVYHFLVQAVKQVEDPARNFFESVEQCKSMLVDSEAVKIRAEYERYQSTNFPATLTDEEAAKISEDARNFLFADLLKSYGYWQILRALPFLGVTFGAFQTFTSSPTK